MSILQCSCGHSSPIPANGLATWRCPKCDQSLAHLASGARQSHPSDPEVQKKRPDSPDSAPRVRTTKRITRVPGREDGRSGIFGQIYEAPADLELHRRIGPPQRNDDLGRVPEGKTPFRVQRRERSVKQNCPICGDSEGVSSSLLPSGIIEFVCDAKHPRTNGPHRWMRVPTSES